MIDYSEEWLFTLLFQVKGSVGVRASMFAIPCALMSLLLIYVDEFYPDLRQDVGVSELSKSQLWTATTAVLGMLLSFRTNRAMARFWEGTGLLHQMRGEWFDSISCCVTFSVGAVATKRQEVYRFRHTIVRLMSLCHGSALEEIAGGTECVATIDSLGLDNATLTHLKNCKEVHEFNRVEVLLHLTQSIITKSLDDGILKIPPPILSRVYQTLSRGFVNLLNAKKIADTRFPFPYAQLIAILLFLHLLLTPLMISCLIQSKVWAPLFTFVPIFAMFSVNFIGVELENPFGTDDNDLPLAHFQGEMNKCLMMLLHESADLIAGVSDHRCVTDFDELAETMNEAVHSAREAKEQSKANARKSVSDFAKYIDINDTSGDHTDFSHQGKKKRRSDMGESSTMDSSLSQLSTSPGAAGPTVEPAQPRLTERMGPMGPIAEEELAASLMPAAKIPQKRLFERGQEQNEPVWVGPPPHAPATPREPKESKYDEKALQEHGRSLPDLRKMVETQVQELSRSISALTEFSDALPQTLDTMLLQLSGAAPSKWRKAMLRRTDQTNSHAYPNGVGEASPEFGGATPSLGNRTPGISAPNSPDWQEFNPDARSNI